MTFEALATLRALRDAGGTISPAELARVLAITEAAAEQRLRHFKKYSFATKGEMPGNKMSRQYIFTTAGRRRLQWAEEVWLPQQQQGAKP